MQLYIMSEGSLSKPNMAVLHSWHLLYAMREGNASLVPLINMSQQRERYKTLHWRYNMLYHTMNSQRIELFAYINGSSNNHLVKLIFGP